MSSSKSCRNRFHQKFSDEKDERRPLISPSGEVSNLSTKYINFIINPCKEKLDKSETDIVIKLI